jgi:cytochrome c oxidase subunit 2
MFTGSSPFSSYVDATFLVIVGISTLVLLGLVGAMIYFIFRYSRKKNPHSTNIEGNVPLEIAWTVIPLILFMGMFYMGWVGYSQMADIPPDAIPLEVTARMWSWSFSYPNGVTTDTLYVPSNRPIKLALRSLDVNHSLYIPAFRIKKDVIPNRTNTMWFSTPEPRSYDIACAEYCGLRHAYMYTKVVALDSSAFERWYQTISQTQNRPYQTILARGASPN